MNMFSQNEIILMIGVVSALLICIIILTILDIREYLKEKKGLTNEEITFGEEFSEKEEVIVPTKVEITEKKPDEILVSDVKEDVSSDDILLEEMEDEKFDVVMNEANVIKEETIVPTVTTKPKKVLDAFEDLDEIENNLPNKKDDITNFEMEQERTAIISLDELLKKSNELYDNNETFQYDDGNEPISIDEVIKMFNKEEDKVDVVSTSKEVPDVYQEVVEEKKELYSKKETIPFISSVYGIEKENNALEFENTATYEKLDRQNYNDFVNKLREMNENK